MKQELKSFLRNHLGEVIAAGSFIVSISLAIASFVCPPMGSIDQSVLAFIGEIGVFSTLTRIPDVIRAVKEGKSLEINTGKVSLKVESDKEDNN